VAVELAFQEAGEGPPVVILHGLFGSKRNWTSIARQLAATHRVFAVDLRNHGESPWAARHDYPALADDVAHFLEQRLDGPAAVIGHSMGGKAAMVLALTRPELVERLVAVDIPPAESIGTQDAFIEAMRQVPLATLTRRTEVDALLAEAIPDRGIRSFLLTNVGAGPQGLSWTINLDTLASEFAMIRGFPDMAVAEPFAKPALFLVGGRSEYVQPQHHAEIRRLFPAAEIAVIPEAGHWVHAEAPEAFLAAVQRFLVS
jgi:pimeloyl-ACP methyl ester carboxylesterase